MKNFVYKSGFLLLVCFLGACSSKSDFSISSPDGQITAKMTFDKKTVVLNYTVQSREHEIITASQVGLSTSIGDFTGGMKLKKYAQKTIDETYTLPQGKVSTYRNNANELTVVLKKEGKEVDVIFRVYNDGIAFRYEIPGVGEIEISGENSAIQLAGENFTYWGQNHPNRYGYESALGPIDGEQMSNPVLAHIQDHNHYVLMGQAATNGTYIQPHFQRTGSKFQYSFPLDQE